MNHSSEANSRIIDRDTQAGTKVGSNKRVIRVVADYHFSNAYIGHASHNNSFKTSLPTSKLVKKSLPWDFFTYSKFDAGKIAPRLTSYQALTLTLQGLRTPSGCARRAVKDFFTTLLGSRIPCMVISMERLFVRDTK